MVRNPTKYTGKSTKSTGFDSDARVLTGYRSASICAFAFKIKFEEAEISNATGLLEQLLKVCPVKPFVPYF